MNLKLNDIFYKSLFGHELGVHSNRTPRYTDFFLWSYTVQAHMTKSIIHGSLTVVHLQLIIISFLSSKSCVLHQQIISKFLSKKKLSHAIYPLVYISVHVSKNVSWKGAGWHHHSPSIPDATQAPSSEINNSDGLRHKHLTCNVNNT